MQRRTTIEHFFAFTEVSINSILTLNFTCHVLLANYCDNPLQWNIWQSCNLLNTQSTKMANFENLMYARPLKLRISHPVTAVMPKPAQL